jgi:hypothetical protein
MSFWKKLLRKNNQEVVQENLTIEDEIDVAQLDVDSSDIQEDEIASDIVVDALESTSSEEVAPQSDVADDTPSLDAESPNTAVIGGDAEESMPEASSAQSEEAVKDSKVVEAGAKSDEQAAEELLKRELESAEASALAAQLEIEKQDFLEDLSVLDGRILPQLKVPDWREELEFVKERYEPCDLSDHIVKVSKRRLTVRQIDHELAESRLHAYERYFERASRRFKDKVDEDALLNQVLVDITEWKHEQSKSVAWKLVERINEEVVKAKKAEEAATSFVENNTEFVNPAAVKVYREFARRAWLIPIVTLYITSVVGLTYNRFEWFMKFLPFFNLGLPKTLIMITGVATGFWISNLWKYSKNVARIQKKLVTFKAEHEKQHLRIKHAVKEHTRLAQQQPLVEPILQVLAKGYRVQLQSDVLATVNATTNFDAASLPACVTLARALDTEEDKMMRLRTRAFNVLKTAGWRTDGLNDIIRIHADSRMLDAQSLSLRSLDSDSMVSASNTKRTLLEAFSNMTIHNRVSKARLIRAIKEIHKEVLANWNSEDRPRVESLRENGFNHLTFRTSWLAEEDSSESWVAFLSEVLTEETAPFGQFNILDKRSEINSSDQIISMAVVPHYFKVDESRVQVIQSSSNEIMPLDVVVRVDVSPWADTSAFTVFADDLQRNQESSIPTSSQNRFVNGGTTDA